MKTGIIHVMENENIDNFRKKFDEIYHNKLLGIIKPYEEKRKKTLLKYIFWALLSVIFIITGFYLHWNLEVFFKGLNEEVAGYIAVLPSIIGFFMVSVPSIIAKEFENDIKKKVMPQLLSSLKTIRWIQEKAITDSFINQSELFTVYNRRYDDDHFIGKYKNVAIEICETELGYYTRCGKNSSYSVRFKGVLVCLKPDRTYKGTVLIKKQGLLNTKPKGLEQINLEDIEFEKQFNVYSDDQIEARYVLTTAFMERFKNLAFAFKANKIEASIKNQGILIGLTVKHDLFKVAKLYKPICDYAQFKQMAEEFASILELIEELKMDQNIGL